MGDAPAIGAGALESGVGPAAGAEGARGKAGLPELFVTLQALNPCFPPTPLRTPTPDSKPPGSALMASETVRKIGFTGSTAVGKSLMAQAANVRAGQGRGLRVGGRARRLWPVRIPW
jgi:hypothetical protein